MYIQYIHTYTHRIGTVVASMLPNSHTLAQFRASLRAPRLDFSALSPSCPSWIPSVIMHKQSRGALQASVHSFLLMMRRRRYQANYLRWQWCNHRARHCQLHRTWGNSDLLCVLGEAREIQKEARALWNPQQPWQNRAKAQNRTRKRLS